MWPSPRKLCGTRLTLLPLSHAHAAQLAQATKITAHMPEGCRLPVRHDMQGEISYLLERQADGLGLSYAIQTSDSRLIGWVSFSSIDRANKRLEIGNLWLASKDVELFVEIMTMLMTFGFEIAGANTIQLRSLADNSSHRMLLAGLGANLDGVLRGVIVAKDGSAKDVAVYSILNTEWSTKSDALLARLN